MLRLVEPSILHLLATQQARYGYELIEQANRNALTDSTVDAAVVYRTLRTLEEAGCVVSEWQHGSGGPARRMYQITEVGQQHLQDWLTVLDRHAQKLAGFVQQARTD